MELSEEKRYEVGKMQRVWSKGKRFFERWSRLAGRYLRSVKTRLVWTSDSRCPSVI